MVKNSELSWLSWTVLVLGLSWGLNQDVSWSYSHRQAERSWKVCFQEGSLTWLSARGLSSSPTTLPKSCVSVLTTWLLAALEHVIQRERQKPLSGWWPSLESDKPSLLPYSVATHSNPSTKWERTTQAVNTERRGSLGAILATVYYTFLCPYTT